MKLNIILSTISIFIINHSVVAQQINCKVNEAKDSVFVSMKIPHPNNALIGRPNGETVWLQTSAEYLHEQIKDFANLKTWTIDKDSLGTVFVDGKASVQKIFNGSGQYQLYIADDLETEPEETNHSFCNFEIK